VELNPDELLLAQNESGKTALHIAAQRNRVEILQKLWVWAEEVQQNTNDLKKKLLLAKDKYGYMAWHRAALRGRLEVFETLRGWAKEADLSQLELLLAQCEERANALHLAADGNHVEILQKLWVWIEEEKMNTNYLKKNLLQAKDKYGYIAWHIAAEERNLVALEILWSWAKKAELNPDELLLPQNKEGETALHLAVKGNHTEMLEQLRDSAEEAQQISSEIKNKLY
jgi:ankyrin repeat protein